MTFGFLGTGEAVSPWGLLSFGFLWPCDAIWSPGSFDITTSWNAASTTLTTNWTGPTGTPWAEC